jgi:hypothetical protein
VHNGHIREDLPLMGREGGGTSEQGMRRMGSRASLEHHLNLRHLLYIRRGMSLPYTCWCH